MGKKAAVLIYQPINSATVMAGNFQLEYQHGVPSFNHCPEILEKNSWKSNRHYIGCPSCHNLNWSNWRFNCALRLHREHKPDCPAGKRTGREEGLLQSAGNGQHDRNVQATNKNNLKQGRALGDVPSVHDPYLSSKKPRLTEPFLSCVFSSLLHHFSFSFMLIEWMRNQAHVLSPHFVCLSRPWWDRYINQVSSSNARHSDGTVFGGFNMVQRFQALATLAALCHLAPPDLRVLVPSNWTMAERHGA